jgi:hypothetical protein
VPADKCVFTLFENLRQNPTNDYKNENCSDVETTHTTHTYKVCSDVVDTTNSILSGSLADDEEEF